MSTVCTLITGASSGIGQQIAIQLSEQHDLILCGRDAVKLQQTAEKCKNSDRHFIWQYDLEQVGEIKESLAKFLTNNELNVDNYIHCAGNMKVMHMKNIDYKSSLQIFNINFFSATEIIALLLKKNNKEHLKNIVFISAILGQYGARGHNLYSATKAALDGLMRSLAVELAPAVRVNSVLPGGVRTPMSEAAYSDPAILEKALKEYPLGIGETNDVADMVEFLISGKAKWITGQQMTVDGGRTINLSQK